MALSALQIQQLNAANQRVSSGQGTEADRRNLAYATSRQGYKAPVQGGPVGAVALDPLTQKRNARAQFQSQGYSYLGTMDEVKAATQKYGSGRVKNIAGDYFVIPAGIGVNPNGPIPANQLSGDPYASLSKMLGANVSSNMVGSDIAGLLALYGADTEGQQQYDELTKQLIETQGKLGNQATDIQAEFEKQGVNAAYQQVKELTMRAAQLQGELGKFDAETEQVKSNIEEQAIPTGLIQGQTAALQKQRDLTRLAKTADLSATIALTQAYQGNAQLGMQLAQTAVDLKYQPILNQIETLKTQIGFAGEKLSKEEKTRFAVIDQLIGIKQQEIQEEKAKAAQIESVAIEAASNGAPLALVTSIRNAKDAASAAQVASQFLNANVQFKREKELIAYRESFQNSGAGLSTLENLIGKKFAAAEQLGFSRVPKSDGGFDFFQNGKPVSVEDYSRGTGITVSESLQGSRAAQDVRQNLPEKAKSSIVQLGAANAAINQIGEALAGVKLGSFGPAQRVTGTLASLLGKSGLNANVKRLDTLRNGFLATLARASGERGVLTDQDVARAKKLLPSTTDTYQEAQQKMRDLRTFLQEQERTIIETYGGISSGNTGGFDLSALEGFIQ